MNHCVPTFDMDEDYTTPTSSGLSRPRKSPMHENDVTELLWQNGQLVMQSQNHRGNKKLSHSQQLPFKLVEPFKLVDTVIPGGGGGGQYPVATTTNHGILVQEDEMTSWLHYPLDDVNCSFDRDFCADLLYSNPCLATATTTTVLPSVHGAILASASRPPSVPLRMRDEEGDYSLSSRVQNFLHFSTVDGRAEPGGPSVTNRVVRESTVVDSSDTPEVGPDVIGIAGGGGCFLRCGSRLASTSGGGGGGVAPAAGGTDVLMRDITVISSPDGSSASTELPPKQIVAPEDRKRKAREADETDCASEDIEFESADGKKIVRGSTSGKRSRAAEVHNLSERRRRDRINEKMKALQELIPRCNKSDKASMLDEAIEYLKSLQLQVQMMSMGCSMVPVMFHGVQQYMQPMGIGMGMGMNMDMSRPMMPFPMPTPGPGAHLGPRFPMPAFHMPPVSVPAPDPSRIQGINQTDSTLNSLGTQNANQPRTHTFSDPCQHYLGLQQMQLPLPQNQARIHPSTSKTSTTGAENLENRQSG